MTDASKSTAKDADVEASAPAEATPRAAAPAPAAADPAPAPAPAPVPVAETPKAYVAIREFVARFEHQVHKFAEGQQIDARVGHALRALGCPIKIVEKVAEDIKAAR